MYLLFFDFILRPADALHRLHFRSRYAPRQNELHTVLCSKLAQHFTQRVLVDCLIQTHHLPVSQPLNDRPHQHSILAQRHLRTLEVKHTLNLRLQNARIFANSMAEAKSNASLSLRLDHLLRGEAAAKDLVAARLRDTGLQRLTASKAHTLRDRVEVDKDISSLRVRPQLSPNEVHTLMNDAESERRVVADPLKRARRGSMSLGQLRKKVMV